MSFGQKLACRLSALFVFQGTDPFDGSFTDHAEAIYRQNYQISHKFPKLKVAISLLLWKNVHLQDRIPLFS